MIKCLCTINIAVYLGGIMKYFHHEFSECFKNIFGAEIELNVINYSQSPDTFLMHTNNSYELHFVKKGSAIININNATTEICEGDFYLVSPNTPHCIATSLSEDLSGYCINFSCRESKNIDVKFWDFLIKCKNNGSLISSYDFDISTYCEYIHNEYIHQKLGYIEKIMAYCVCILVDIKRCLTVQTNLSSVSINRLRSIDRYLNKNLSTFNTTDLANSIFVSKRQLTRIIKKTYGKNLSEVITEKRILCAKNLLINSNLSISEIASISGYSSQKYFSNTFKKITGLTPKQYRNIRVI